MAIVSVPCCYEGERFCFICPMSGVRCELLNSAGGHPFVSRKAARLTYATQSRERLTSLQTACLKAEKTPALSGWRRRRRRGRRIDLEAAAEDIFLSERDRRFGDKAKE